MDPGHVDELEHRELHVREHNDHGHADDERVVHRQRRDDLLALMAETKRAEEGRPETLKGRRLAAVALSVVVVVVVGGVAWLFLSNTKSLTIVEDAGPVFPGDEMTIEVADREGDCGPSFERLYQKTLFGRWRLTHLSDDGRQWERHDRGLLSTGSWKEFSPLPCAIGNVAPLVVPRDVTWSPVVACSASDSNCVEIEVTIANG